MKQTMNYSAFIFDLDGTLLNTLDDITNAVNYAMRKMGYPEKTLDEVRSFVGNGIRMLVKRAIPLNASDDDFEKAHTFFTEYYLVHIADYTRPYDGVTELVKR